MKTLVLKFGGTSVGSSKAHRCAAEIVLTQSQEWEGVVVVVSAMGGVTDALIEGARSAAGGDEHTYGKIDTALRARHHRVICELLEKGEERDRLLTAIEQHLDDYASFCGSVHVLGEVTPRAMDAITSLGERINSRILAAYLRDRGLASEAVDATNLIVTDDKFQNAAPLMSRTKIRVEKKLLPRLRKGQVPVITGFIAATEQGIITTLGRGGSDYSASVLGVCLNADEVWIWTDVDGVMSSDPKLVPEARTLPLLSYNEVSELAYFGAKVVHPRTIRPVVEHAIPLWVKNTFNPGHPGTRIDVDPQVSPNTVKAVTAIEGLSMITVEGRGMMGVPGIAARTFSAVARQGASVLMITQASSEQSISFLIPTENARHVLGALEEEMTLELDRKDIDRIWSRDEVVIVTAVGAGLRGTPGVGARIFGALSQARINVIAVAQGSSECSISLVLSEKDVSRAVRSIHQEVVLPLKGSQGR